MIIYQFGLSTVPNEASSDRFKQVQSLAVLLMIKNRPIAAGDLHRTFLSLAGVEENPRFLVAIAVSILMRCLASEQKNYGVIGRSTNSSLSLAAKLFMQKASAVDFTYCEVG